MANSYFLQRFAFGRNKSFLRCFGLLLVLLFTGSGEMKGQLSESFETGLPSSYSSTLQNATLGTGAWQIQDVIAGTTGVQTGTKSAQIRSATAAQMITPSLSGGVGIISFYVTASTISGAYQVNVSTDNGTTWSAAPGSPFTIGTTKTLRTITVNNANVNKVQFYRTGATIYIDDVSITTYGSVSAPTTQASAINFTGIGQTGMTANWTNGNGAKRIVIMNTSNSFTTPADGIDPSANTVYGGSGEQVVYNGTGTSVAVTGLSASTTYYFRVYEYNGSSATTKYLTTTGTNNPNSQATTTATPTPTITVINTTLSGFTYAQGAGPSTEKIFTVSGLNLTNDISIAATTNYEISTGTGASFAATNPIKLTQSGGTVASTIIYVRLKAGLTQATYNGEVIDISSNGANSAIVTCSGSVTAPPAPNAPIATAATDITATGFTANWGTVENASGYDLSVYTKSGSSTIPILSENFDLFIAGSLAAPDGTDISPTLNTYTQATEWTGTKVYQAGGTTKIGSSSALGSITTPSLDLTGTNVTLKFKAMGWSGDATTINVLLDGVLIATPTIIADQATWTPILLPITGGIATSKITFQGKQATKSRFYLEDVTITKGGLTLSPISGSPFTVTSATSKVITGLNPDTEYFYTVVAKNLSASSVASNEISVTTLYPTFTGTGDWSETARWNTGTIPVSTDDVVIDGDATIGSNVEINGVTVNSGKSLTVNFDKQLTISGSFTNNGTFTLQSGATAITNGTVSGNGVNNVNQSLTYRTWYMSSPVATASPVGMLRIKSYNEQTDLWSIDNSQMVVGKGYSVTPPNDGTNNILFTGGSLNTGEKTITLDKKGSTSQAGFNFVGNPYPSYIDWKAMVTKNNAVLENGTMWYRTKIDATTYKYFTVDAAGVVVPGTPSSITAFIPPMQGFWVKTNADGSTLYFENDMRSHAGTVANPSPNPLKAPAAQTSELPLLRLQVSNGTNVDEAVIYSYAAATNGYDFYDSPKMSNNDATIPEIYTTLNNKPMVINVMNSLPLDTEIGLAFVPGDASSFSLKVSEISNLPSDVKVILKDYANSGLETDLTDGVTVYNFAPATTTGDRFSVIFRSTGSTTGVDTNNDNAISVYSIQNGINITLNSGLDENACVRVFNAVGQQLINQHLTNRSTTVKSNFTPGVYVVKVSNGPAGTVTQKIVIK